MVATLTEREVAPVRPAADRSFERWGIAAYLAAVAVLVAGIVIRLGGPLVFVLDDPAIHMSMADTLLHHGTWGVAAGSFQSASSSPLWTLLVAAGMAVMPGADAWAPLVLNVAAGVAVVVILGRNQTVLRPGRGRPLDAVAVVGLVTVVLFLPGLTVAGMEHTLHVALTLGVVALFQRRSRDAGDLGGFPAWAPYALLALATLTRFETAFVGAGLVAALVAERGAARRREIAGVMAAVGVPLVAFALVNVALGGGVLPNSVLAKGQGLGAGNPHSGLGPLDALGRLTSDPFLAALVAFALGYIVLTWGRPVRCRLTAITVVVASLAHMALADVGWFERYQAYLIALGVYLVLGVIAEAPADLRRRAVAALVVVAVLFTPAKANLLLRTPQYADETYRHSYQAGLFLERYYDGQPIATDQLGYITLFHDGPTTDFAGLGDYDVLRHHPARSEFPRYWAELTARRGFRVAVLPQVTSAFATPDTWVRAGTFRIDGPYDGISRGLEVWATTPDEVTALQAHLREFEPRLPPGMTLEMNDFAAMQADVIRSRA